MPSAPDDSRASLELREARVGQILNEFLDRQRRSVPVDEAALLAAHPDLADDLRADLDALRALRPAQNTIERLIRQGILAAPPPHPDPPTAPAASPGDSHPAPCVALLGRYRILGLIGRGGMGIVLKAFDPALRRFVALKLLRPELNEDSAALARFSREARAAAALQHPHIVTVHAIEQINDIPYIVMEYVDGPSLADLLRRPAPQSPSVAPSTSPTGASSGARSVSPLPPDLIRTLFDQLLAALAAAHAAGLVHRDVKPSNILLEEQDPRNPAATAPGAEDASCVSSPSEEPRPVCPSPPGVPGPYSVKLADFGLARVRSAATLVTLDASVLGTPEYMSPEQARGDPNIDHRTDLYSAGVVLFEMLTGRTPFHCDTPSATLQHLLADEPPDPRQLAPDCDPVLASLVVRLLAQRPDERIPSARAALDFLDTNEPVPMSVRRPRFSRRRLTLIPLLAVGITILTGLGYSLQRSAHPTASAPSGAPPRITKVELSGNQLDVLASYGDSLEKKRLLWLERFGYHGLLSQPALVTLPDAGTIVIIGTGEPPDPNDHESTVFAFNTTGELLWRWAPKPPWNWPDAQPARYWTMRNGTAGDIDGDGVNELVIVASHPDLYPCRISVLDPARGTVRSTFWHFGHVASAQVVPDYFPDHRPAIVAGAFSNHLDGFSDGLRGPERPIAHWDVVWAVMVLDPRRMDGLAPPPVDPARLAELGWPADLQPAPVAAYAFLDRPIGDVDPYVEWTPQYTQVSRWRERMPAAFVARISEILTRTTLPGAKLEVRLVVPPPDSDRIFTATLHVGPNLELLDLLEPPQANRGMLGTDRAFWEQYWHPLIQHGQYVDSTPQGRATSRP